MGCERAERVGDVRPTHQHLLVRRVFARWRRPGGWHARRRRATMEIRQDRAFSGAGGKKAGRKEIACWPGCFTSSPTGKAVLLAPEARRAARGESREARPAPQPGR